MRIRTVIERYVEGVIRPGSRLPSWPEWWMALALLAVIAIALILGGALDDAFATVVLAAVGLVLVVITGLMIRSDRRSRP
jgi:hypothetical protein